MSIYELLVHLREEATSVISSDFEVEVRDTRTVPTFDDPDITYDDLDSSRKRCKRLKSCVLYVDIRRSTQLNVVEQPEELAKIYSIFVRSMMAAARHFRGHVRNIIGDRVMVVFDEEGCFSNAINSAILMNSVAKYVVAPLVKAIPFRCGIGVDYGSMLIAKAGAVRKGAELEFYRSLVWLGRPANIASRLTDLANTTHPGPNSGIHEGLFFPLTQQWSWRSRTFEDFVGDLEPTYSQVLRHKDPYFSSFFKTVLTSSATSYPPILISREVFEGYSKESPSEPDITGGWWSEQASYLEGHEGPIVGADIIFAIAQAIPRQEGS